MRFSLPPRNRRRSEKHKAGSESWTCPRNLLLRAYSFLRIASTQVGDARENRAPANRRAMLGPTPGNALKFLKGDLAHGGRVGKDQINSQSQAAWKARRSTPR